MIERVAVYSVYFVFGIIPIWTYFIMKMADAEFAPDAFDIPMLIKALSNVLTHGYMIVQFGLRLRFFILKRQEYDELTRYNLWVIGVTFFIWALNIFYVGILIYYSLSFLSWVTFQNTLLY